MKVFIFALVLACSFGLGAAGCNETSSLEDQATVMSAKALDELAKMTGGNVSVAVRAAIMLVVLYFVVLTVAKVIATRIELQAAADIAQGQKAAAAEEADADAPSGGVLAYGDYSTPGAAMNSVKGIFTGFFSLQSMQSMLNAMALVPMLAILILFARMRAVMDLQSEPQDWAKVFFLLAAASIYITAISVIFFPKSGSGCCYWFGKVIDWASMLMLYGSILVIMASIATLCTCENEKSKIQWFYCRLLNHDVKDAMFAMNPADNYWLDDNNARTFYSDWQSGRLAKDVSQVTGGKITPTLNF